MRPDGGGASGRDPEGPRQEPPPAEDLDGHEAEYGDVAGLPRPRRRKDASMTLLTSMFERPLDPGYAAAAEQREARGLPAATSGRRPFLLVSLLAIGLVIGISTADLRQRDDARSGARGELIEQVRDRRAAVDERGDRVRELQGEIDAATADLDPGLIGAGEDEMKAMRVASGLVAVRGPGLRLTLDDAPTAGTDADGDPRAGTSDENRVLSGDLQIITNGLWDAGAEAIAINGQRLTSRSAIRFAGEAILVNFRPLTRPYTIEAIGDPESMRTQFTQGSAGTYLEGLHTHYDIRTSMSTHDDLRLPGAVDVGIREADVIPSGSPAPPVVPMKEESS